MLKEVQVFIVFAFLFSLNVFSQENEYVVVSGKGIKEDSEWTKVVQSLKKEHQATVVYYKDSLPEVLPELQKIRPRYVAVVEKPDNIGRKYVIELNKLSRKVDSDIYADFLWGIITGYTPESAMRMMENSRTPLVIKNGMATIAELKSGKWFDAFGYLDDHVPGVWGEKCNRNDTVKEYPIFPLGADRNEKVLGKFGELYAKYNPDLLVTASHATERNLEMPFSLGNVRSKEGVLFLDTPQKTPLIESGKRRVYLPIGNCLIGNVNNTRESMAVAWMNSANVAAMVGYVVTTWHGRAGWGALKYWLTTPGCKTLSEAVFLNQQDLIYHLNEWNPKLATVDYPHGNGEWNMASQLLMDIMGRKPDKDQIGYLHDRDVLVYYGDPKWNVRLQEIPAEKDYTVSCKIKGHQCTVTITTGNHFSLEKMKGDRFKMESVEDLPFSYFFPTRLKNPRLAKGQDWKVAVDENFLLVYDINFRPKGKYAIIFDID